MYLVRQFHTPSTSTESPDSPPISVFVASRIATEARRHWRNSRSRSLTVSLGDDDEEAEKIEMKEAEKYRNGPRRESRPLSSAGHHNVVFKKRTCRKFAKRGGGRSSLKTAGNVDTRCWCGRTYSEHKGAATARGGLAVVEVVETVDKWETYFALCSDAVDDTDAFGNIKFTVDGMEEHDYWFAEEKIPYVRFDKDTSANFLFDQLLRHKDEWNLGDPGLIISVVGDVYGAAYAERVGGNEDSAKSAFRDCLLGFFKDTPNSWVVTGGTHTGIGRFVGEVVREINMTKNQVEERNENVSITCIGVANWGNVKNRHILVDPEIKRRPKQFTRTATYDVPSQGYGFIGPLGPHQFDRSRNEEYLDPNHTHFLLIDDGTIGRKDDAIPFTFRDKIMEISSCPCANLLFGGGLNALDDIIHSLTKVTRTNASASSIDEVDGDYRTPCIVIKGSGYAADMIALGMELLEAKRKSDNVQEYIDDIVSSKAMRDFMENAFGDIKNVKWRLKRCLENHQLIYIFDPHEDETVNVEVLKAFHRHGMVPIREKFEVAYLWNRIEVATEIWREMVESGAPLSSDKWVIKALAEGNLAFTQLFLTHACDNGNFLTQTQLRNLYVKYTRKAKRKQIETYLERESSVEVNGFESYMKRLAGFYADYQEDFDMGKRHFMMADYTAMFSSTSQLDIDNTKKSYPQTCADLFVWCVFVGHYDIANWLIRLTRHPTAFGLMAANILRGSIKIAESKDEKQELEERAAEFEQYAVDVLCRCYMTDPLKAKFVMVQGLDIFDRTSCMELASRDKHCLEFICHPACQSHLTDIWRRCHKKSKPSYRSVTILAAILWTQIVMSPFSVEHAAATFHSPTMAVLVILFAILVNLLLIVATATRAMKTMRKSKKPVNHFKELRGHEATNNYLFSIGIECGYSKSSATEPDCLQNAADFFKSPVVKFYLHCTSYAVYLLVFAYFLLFDTHANFVLEVPSSFEFMIYIFWISYITQEFKQIAKNDLSAPLFQSNWRPWLTHAQSSFKLYFTSVWNWYDVILLSSTTLIGIFRLTLFLCEPGPIHTNCEQYLTLAYSVVFALFLVRLLQFFLVNILLGPKLLMIAQMLMDLSYFALFLIIFLCSFSLVSHTMLEVLSEDQERKITVDLIANLFRRGFWNLFGETFLEEYTELYDNIKEKNGTATLNLPTYAELSTKILIPLLQGIYMFVTVVLLLNLLIAIFTYNITKLQEKEIKLWYIHRREVIFEYFHRPSLPQPLSLIVNVRDCILWTRNMMCQTPLTCFSTSPQVFSCRMLCIYPDKSLSKHNIGEKILKRVQRWEKMMSNSVQEAKRTIDQSDSGYTIGEIHKSVRTLTKMQMLEDVSLENLDMKRKLAELEKMVQKVSKQLKQQQEESQRSLAPKSEPCRANCPACQKLVYTDKFYFQADGDAYFVRERIDCNTCGLIVGVTCSRCFPERPVILQILRGFSVVETPQDLPRGNRPQPLRASGSEEQTRVNYLKKIFRDLILEALEAPDQLHNHFQIDGHIPYKHIKFVGIETINVQKKSGIMEKVQLWEQRCGQEK